MIFMKKRALVLGSYLCLLLLVGCGAPKVVHTSSEVDIAYALTFLDGNSLSAGETTLMI
ncbi:MAG: hypothetical protein LBI53_07715 [Candidatus Peribacteria bacterium]|nr:hypothetical protein [Candidatus Peribacteria bacterium]